MKKLLLLSIFVPTIAYSSSAGFGEYRFGPETPENLACEIAEERARQDAIMQFVGEQIEYHINQNCQNEDCQFQREVYSEIKGVIKKVIERERKVIDDENSKNCLVFINAEVEKIDNDINLKVVTKDIYKDGEKTSFSVYSNIVGNVYAFNYYNYTYNKLGSVLVEKPHTEYRIPDSKNQLVAVLPIGQNQSNEILAFVFTEENIQVKDKYTANEFRSMLSSLDGKKKYFVQRSVTIVR